MKGKFAKSATRTKSKPEEHRAGLLGAAESIQTLLKVVSQVGVRVVVRVFASRLRPRRDGSDESGTSVSFHGAIPEKNKDSRDQQTNDKPGGGQDEANANFLQRTR